LPDDYVPEAATAEEPAAAAEAAPAVAEAPAAAAAPKRPRRAAPVVPPSLAEETPLADALPGAAVVTSAAPASGAPAAPAGPRPPAADAAALRGEAIQAVEKALRAGARTPGAPDPLKPGEYSGPDGELLRLQDEVLALALEALRRPK